MPLHNIAPVFDRHSKVLILGSFPSPKSREQGFFYGHPQNRMWRVLAAVLQETCPVSVEDKIAFLRRNGIAMWDVLASCEIDGASDSSIRQPVPNDLRRIFDVAEICAVFTTGQTAAALYRKFFAARYRIPYIALPSTSPANASMSLEFLTEAYQQIAWALRPKTDT